MRFLKRERAHESTSTPNVRVIDSRERWSAIPADGWEASIRFTDHETPASWTRWCPVVAWRVSDDPVGDVFPHVT